MHKALLLIDLSKDFIDLTGSLNCGESGTAIVPYCKNLVKAFLAEGCLVFDARDLHDEADYEIASGLFPPHNLRGTSGQQLIDALAAELEQFPAQWIRISKKQYNACYETDLLAKLQEYGITEIHLVGVCTDICVRYTVDGLYQFKTTTYPELDIVVHSQGTASFNPVGHRDSLQHFAGAFGVKVI